MSRTIQIQIGLAVGTDGEWIVPSQDYHAPHGAVDAAETAADYCGIGARGIIVTLNVPIPEPCRVTVDVPADEGRVEGEARAHLAALASERDEALRERDNGRQKDIDHIVHYRNLAISLGAKPTDMLDAHSRKLAESGTGGNEWNDAPETWEENERLEAAIANATDLISSAEDALHPDFTTDEEHGLDDCVMAMHVALLNARKVLREKEAALAEARAEIAHVQARELGYARLLRTANETSALLLKQRDAADAEIAKLTNQEPTE